MNVRQLTLEMRDGGMVLVDEEGYLIPATMFHPVSNTNTTTKPASIPLNMELMVNVDWDSFQK